MYSPRLPCAAVRGKTATGSRSTGTPRRAAGAEDILRAGRSTERNQAVATTEQHRPHKGSAHIMSVKQRKRRDQTQDQQDLVQVLRENIGQPFSASELKYRTSVPKHLMRGLLTGVSDIAISEGPLRFTATRS